MEEKLYESSALDWNTLNLLNDVIFKCSAGGCPFEDKYQVALNHI